MEKVAKINIEGAKVLHESKFSKHIYDAKTETLCSDWFEETKNMTRNDFEIEMKAWLKATQDCGKFTYLLDRCVDFIYPISPQEQIWMANLLNKSWIELGLKKYAHLIPDEFISHLFVEQTFEEFFNMNLPHQYPMKDFSSVEEALHWLHS
jgi:hypothetical protein